MNDGWVLLYSAAQGAYHIELASEYKMQPANGYEVVATGKSYMAVQRVYLQRIDRAELAQAAERC